MNGAMVFASEHISTVQIGDGAEFGTRTGYPCTLPRLVVLTVFCLVTGSAPMATSVSAGQPTGGSIVAWGWNDDGQCDVPAPNTNFVAVAAGLRHSLGLRGDSSIVGWGNNSYGQRSVPLPNVDFVAVAAGDEHSLGLKVDGSIRAWGRNNSGQLNIPAPNSNFVAVAAGSYHSLGLKVDGSIAAWGFNAQGQCNVPGPNTGFCAVAGGYYHSLGLKSDGSIVAWGSNSYGQSVVPPPNSGFIAVAAERYHSLGVKSDGSVVAWGCVSNDFGQCGVPATSTGFVGVAAGAFFNLGLMADSSIVAWGNNYHGQCDVPEPNVDFIAIAAGPYHSLGLTKFADCNSNGVPDEFDIVNCDGSPWCADCNSNGLPDECDIALGVSGDCQPNGVPDECESLAVACDPLCGGDPCNDETCPGYSACVCIAGGDPCDPHCGGDPICDPSCGGAPCNDESCPEFDACHCIGNDDPCHPACGGDPVCDPPCGGDPCLPQCGVDCNGNGVEDGCDIAAGSANDCNGDRVLDECDLSAGSAQDCNANGVPDECELGGFTQLAKLKAADATPGDSLGVSVAIDGDLVVVGAPYDDDGGSQSGSAYVFHKMVGESPEWQQVAKLTAADAAANDQFGRVVAICGDTIAAGAPYDDDSGSDSGSVYVFRQSVSDGHSWEQVGKLIAPDAASSDDFGQSIAMIGDLLLIGSPYDDDGGSNSGSVYVFREVDEGRTPAWMFFQKLTAADAAPEDYFGWSLAVRGDTAVIGARYDDEESGNSGAAYVFRNVGTRQPEWQQEAKLKALNPRGGAEFGTSVAISDELIVVGAPKETDWGYSGGSAFVFQDLGDGWRQIARLRSTDAVSDGQFGSRVAAGPDWAMVSAPLGSVVGSVYVFRDLGTGAGWGQVAKVAAPDIAISNMNMFGAGLALSGDLAIIGAYGESEGGAYSGAAYVFDASVPGADCNGNGVLDECELMVMDPLNADCNANGVLDICEAVNRDCNANHVPDECEPDCIGNGVPDACDIHWGTATDCGNDGVPDACELAAGSATDCNVSGVPDSCELGYPKRKDLLQAFDAPNDARFGSSLAVQDDLAIVGAPDDVPGPGLEGSVYVFRDEGPVAGWSQVAKLTGTSSLGSGQFGASVAIDGDRMVVGAPYSSWGGRVYFFHAVDGTGDTWELVAKLSPSEYPYDDQFGVSVSISGDTAIVGSPYARHAGVRGGAAYLFREVAGTWQQVGKLTASDALAEDRFGTQVAIDGFTAVVTAGYAQPTKSVYVFRDIGIDSPDWQQVAKLTPADAGATWFSMWQIALKENTIAIVGYGPEGALTSNSTVYLLRDMGALGWRKVAALTPKGYQLPAKGMAFDGNTVVLGVKLNYYPPSGPAPSAVFLFRAVDQNATRWQQFARIGWGDASIGFYVGTSVAVSGDTALISDWDPWPSYLQDVVHVFHTRAASNDCNANGVPDDCEIAESPADYDCDANGVLDDCELHEPGSDCNGNAILDRCELAAGSSWDCNSNGVLDECERDCNSNGVADDCDLVGDMTGDGYCDADDWYWFYDCMSMTCANASCAPAMYADECCRLADIDGDGDVDLEDYAAFQLFFGKYCVLDADCGDGLFCTGEEICIAGSCAAGNAPCSDPNFSICDEELDDCLPTIRYQDDFSAYPCDGDPEDWLDTAANNSMVPDDGQFEVGCPDGNHVLRAATSQVNVHSHYAPPGSEDWPVQSFTGRIFTSTVSAGIGVTFHSDYPNSDTYYRLRRGSFAGGTAFHVDAHGTTITGGTTSSGVAPAANVWYWFRIELADTGTETQIRAKIWPMGDAEPVDWQIDCYDSSSTRRTAGRIGVWSMYAVKSYWDDFEVK